MWTRGNKHTQDCKKICDLKYFASPTIDIQKVATSSEDKKLKDASISDIFYSLTNRVLKEAAGPLQKVMSLLCIFKLLVESDDV